MDKTLVREILMQQCINCGHVEQSQHMCGKCGSAELHLWVADEIQSDADEIAIDWPVIP